MKVSAKRRRTKEEVKEAKRAGGDAQAELARRLSQIQELERANDDLQANLSNTEHVRLQVQSFIDEGQLDINDSGQVSVVDDPARRQELQQQSAQRRASLPSVVLDGDGANPIVDPDQMDGVLDGGQQLLQNNQ